MSEITDKVALLEATEAQIKVKQEELAASAASVEEKGKQKTAMDAELVRVQADITKAKEERRQKETSFSDQLRGENTEAALKRYFDEYKITPEDQVKFREDFKGKSEAVTPDLIFKDILKARVSSNPEHYAELERQIESLKASGVDVTVSSASSVFVGSGTLPKDNTAGLDNDDIRAAQWANIPLETYKRLKAEGKIE